MKKCMQNKKKVEGIQIERITPFRFASFPPMVRLRNAKNYIKFFSQFTVRAARGKTKIFEISNNLFTFR